MERVNTRRMNALSSPESDEVAPFGRFSAGQRHGEETPELLTAYLVRIGRGTLLTPEEELDLGRRASAGDDRARARRGIVRIGHDSGAKISRRCASLPGSSWDPG